MQQPTTTDGRRLRRERNREAVIDALFDLLVEGVGQPPVEAIAERAGLSPSSVFRYFDGIDDLLRQTVERYLERYADRFEVPAIGEGTFEERVRGFVDARVSLYEAIHPIARTARFRAFEHAELARSLDFVRQRFLDQIRTHFAVELRSRPAAEAEDRAVVVDAITSFEAWDMQRTTQGRTPAQVRRAMALGVRAALD